MTGPTDVETELALFRSAIDELDETLIRLVAARGSLVDGVLALKKANGIPLRDEAREAGIRSVFVLSALRARLHRQTGADLAEVVLADSRRRVGSAS